MLSSHKKCRSSKFNLDGIQASKNFGPIFNQFYVERVDRKKKVEHWSYLLVAADALLRQRVKRPSISGFFLSHLNPSPVERGMQGKTLLVNTNIHFDWQSTAAHIWNLTLASSLFFGPAFNAMNRILIKGKATEDNQTLQTQGKAVYK